MNCLAVRRSVCRSARYSPRFSVRLLALLLALAWAPSTAFALAHAAAPQVAVGAGDPFADLARVTDIVAPATRSFALAPRPAGVAIVGVRAFVKLQEQTASTTLELELMNHGATPAEAIVLLPVPDGAAISAFAIEGQSREATAQLLPRAEARRLYDEIVRRLRDPGLLEFAGHSAVKSSVFPVPAHGTQRVRLTYDHLLEREGARIDYVLPRSESLSTRTPWSIDVSVKSRAGVALLYSPSHELETVRLAPDAMTARLAERSRLSPGALRLSYLVQEEELSASLFAYPDPRVGGGYFLLMAGLPEPDAAARSRLRRELTVVLDRSGSMAGAKWDQARAAALQAIEGLADGESFNLIDYSTSVALFAAAPVTNGPTTRQQARAYLDALRPNGGTNIHDALVEALRQPHVEGTLPLVLFLTDGLPTVRATSEAVLREVVERGNPHQRRIFTFGVGADVNAPLLDRIADATRASTTYVLPGEEVELAVAKVCQKLWGPLLADVGLATLAPDGSPDPRRMRERTPATLPDLFAGESLIVLGQYVGEAPLCFEVTGRQLGAQRRFRFTLDVARATTRNAFVPRLFATRRIAYLVDQVRALGVDVGTPGGLPLSADPVRAAALRELTDEILRLSTEFGVLTEYTAFLATDGADFGSWSQLTEACHLNLEGRAIAQRSGFGAVAQGWNYNDRKAKANVDPRNGFLDLAAGDQLAHVEIATVQQVGEGAFFCNRGQWVDSKLIHAAATPAAAPFGAPLGAPVTAPLYDGPVATVIELGSAEWSTLVDELLVDGRGALLTIRGEVLLDHRGRRLRLRLGEQ